MKRTSTNTGAAASRAGNDDAARFRDHQVACPGAMIFTPSAVGGSVDTSTFLDKFFAAGGGALWTAWHSTAT